jgi:hypothetical protein
MKPVNSRTFVCVVATLILFTTSCSRPTTFSPVLQGGFDPVGAFRKHGYTIQTEARGESIRNPEYGYAWQSWSGVVTRTPEPTACNAIAVVIRDELNRALTGTSLDELTTRTGHSEAEPLMGMLRYNKNAVHGDVHVWLTPITSNAAVSYVIFVREERLK